MTTPLAYPKSCVDTRSVAYTLLQPVMGLPKSVYALEVCCAQIGARCGIICTARRWTVSCGQILCAHCAVTHTLS